MKGDLYLGKWRLIPELCLYQTGEVPKSGIYEISENEGVVVISITWQSANGSSHRIGFSGPSDGSIQLSDTAGISELSISRISSTILDSSAFLAGDEIMYARRSASSDGRLLSTVQTGTKDETSFRNFQVYSRDDASQADEADA